MGKGLRAPGSRLRGPLLIRLALVDSTQSFLRRHPELHPCGVMADAQTEGRGRQGNRWESSPGAGLWMSASLPAPDLPPGLVLQRAMAEVIAALDFPFGLKWPNDLVARREDGSLVKLGGILGERVGGRLILGLGLNLRSAPTLPDRAFPAESLAGLGLSVPDPAALARSILLRWNGLATSATAPAFRWPEPGTPLRWEGGQGVCLGWEPDGRLALTTAEGIQRLNAGDVRGMQGEAPP